MRHPDSIELQRFVDGELNSRKARELSKHLDECAECSDSVHAIRGTGDLLRFAFNDVLEGAPLEGFADRVMEGIEKDSKTPWFEGLKVWFDEVFKHQRKVWVPPLALAGAAAAALLITLSFGDELPNREVPNGSTVLSVSFGSSVEGAVFELEDKDGSTTAVIWVDESKTSNDEGEASLAQPPSKVVYAKSLTKTPLDAVLAANGLPCWGALEAKVI
jgi:hypothetical protein